MDVQVWLKALLVLVCVYHAMSLFFFYIHNTVTSLLRLVIIMHQMHWILGNILNFSGFYNCKAFYDIICAEKKRTQEENKKKHEIDMKYIKKY